MKYIYLIRNRENNTVKIGVSVTPQIRAKHLQTGSSGRLELVQEFKAPSWLEKRLHEIFQMWHTNGEWFEEHATIYLLFRYLSDQSRSSPHRSTIGRILDEHGLINKDLAQELFGEVARPVDEKKLYQILGCYTQDEKVHLLLCDTQNYTEEQIKEIKQQYARLDGARLLTERLLTENAYDLDLDANNAYFSYESFWMPLKLVVDLIQLDLFLEGYWNKKFTDFAPNGSLQERMIAMRDYIGNWKTQQELKCVDTKTVQEINISYRRIYPNTIIHPTDFVFEYSWVSTIGTSGHNKVSILSGQRPDFLRLLDHWNSKDKFHKYWAVSP